ncbi:MULTISPECIES: sulfurtransferase complex subunit TusD [unclassified Moritella]|uniref:sulfurtransferase complex subunit TusD n=1 Tax=unclassified Moritella TaxID=2637987 RepID=UPI001BAA0256|nr:MULTISPECIES: sulfurtransferase complex subunit TusD [unclassified Moritella]QUM86829.1 sulfurtransferase complex subunit TusD [Moritella sp. 28]QUM91057.1 sulfurtransferase complex subunit TusD [Moritella sp. 36]
MSKSVTIAVLVTGPAYGSQDALSAYHYVKSAIELGHTIQRVFFYNDGVLNGSTLTSPAADEFDLYNAWLLMAREHLFPLDICSGAALRRGVIDQNEADRTGKNQFNLELPFQLTGLGQLAESIMTADRVIQF